MATKLFLLLILLSNAASSHSERCHPEDKRALLQIKKELNNLTILSSWKPHTDCCKLSWFGVTCFPSNNCVGYLSISNDTDLTSQFPPSIGNLPYLESLLLSLLPNLTGPIPIKPISKLTNLKSLAIISTGISGPIPNFTAQLKNLIYLDLSYNNLTGTLPPSLYKLPSLQEILLNNNKLTGSIPPSYGCFNNRNFPFLSLSHNHLSGRLPMSLARLNNSIIDFSHNRFEGDASMLFGSTKGTFVIDLSWNSFAFDLGKVEFSETLATLDVSHNQIYGNLPMGIENILVERELQ